MLEQIYTSEKAIDPHGATPAFMAYLAAWDALVLYSGSYLDKIFRDGSQANLGAPLNGAGKVNRIGGRYALTYPYSGYSYGTDEITGQIQPGNSLHPDWEPSGGLSVGARYLDDLQRLMVIATGYGEASCYDCDTGALLGSITLAAAYYHNIAYLAAGQVVLISHDTGKVAGIDYRSRTVRWQSTVPPCVLSAVDCRHQLLITLQSDNNIRVFILAAVPAVLANPAFVSAETHAHQYVGQVVRTRLLGGAGEPCPDWVIHWSLAPEALGALLHEKSRTDADGYADNFYFGPAVAAGSETILASVTV